jgi:hypothetical protein
MTPKSDWPQRPEVEMTETITARRFHEAEGVEDWRVVGDGACTFFRTDLFAPPHRPTPPIPD